MQPSPLYYRIPGAAPTVNDPTPVRFGDASLRTQTMENSTPHHTQFYKNYNTSSRAPNASSPNNSKTKFAEHISDHRSHHQRAKAGLRRRKKPKQSKWQSLFCLDGSALPQANEFFDFSKTCKGSEGKKPKYIPQADHRCPSGDFDHIKIYDGSYVPLGFEDDMSNDWDLMKGVKPSTRAGPQRKSSTDLQIQVRDLFPCLGDIFDFLGCAKKKKLRARVEQRSGGRHTHPQLETVCLECGHILDQKTLEKTILRDTTVGNMRGVADYTRLPRAHIPNSQRPPAPFDYGYGEVNREWERESAYSGYKNWQYQDNDTGAANMTDEELEGASIDAAYPRRRLQESFDKQPLPRFQLNETRTFKSRPGAGHRKTAHQTDYFDVDATGYVALPRFNKK